MSVSSIKLSVACLLLLGVALIFVSEGAEAELSLNPVWEYETDGNVEASAISADGNYMVVGSNDDYVYLFHRNSSTPLWSYESYGDVSTVAISSDGSYIVAGDYSN
ncbi:MAG: PQQ-binding-like beta-propeller repeat protein, partial [Candidatus Poseidoniia archaeon]|nr:PQQ-binding-like beta-propeller repeat protein [Candidatus Poseidoniia archaeon]